jgi:hypothetical protein
MQIWCPRYPTYNLGRQWGVKIFVTPHYKLHNYVLFEPLGRIGRVFLKKSKKNKNNNKIKKSTKLTPYMP